MYSERAVLLVLNKKDVTCLNVLKELVSLRRNIFSLGDGRNCDPRITISIINGDSGGQAR